MLNTILDWLGKHEAMVVALGSFITAIVIAKITTSLELRKALSIKRVEAYESAKSYLTSMLNAYENLLLYMEEVHRDKDSSTIETKISLLIELLSRLHDISKKRLIWLVCHSIPRNYVDKGRLLWYYENYLLFYKDSSIF